MEGRCLLRARDVAVLLLEQIKAVLVAHDVTKNVISLRTRERAARRGLWHRARIVRAARAHHCPGMSARPCVSWRGASR